MIHYKQIIPSLAIILSATLITAQEQMSLQRYRELALQHDEDVRMAGMQLEKAKAERAVARTYRLPSISASGTGAYLHNDFDYELTLPTMRPNLQTGMLEPNIMVNPQTGEPIIGTDGNPLFNMYAWMPLSLSIKGAYTAGLMLEQPVYTGGKINAGTRLAKIGMEMAGENIGLQKENTLLEADRAYWNFVAVGEKVQLAQHAVDMLSKIVEVAQNSVEVGLAHQNDLLKARLEYSNALLSLREAQNGLELSRMNLCRIAGLPLEASIVATDTVIAVKKNPFTEGKESIQNRPEFRMLEKSIKMHDQQIKMAKADFLPTGGVQAGFRYIGGIELGPEKISSSGLSVMASVKIPIFHWGEGSNTIKSARIDKEIKGLELEKNKQLMQLEMEQARLNLQVAFERIQLNELALEQAEENMRITRDNYEVGMQTLSDYLMSQTQWQEVYSNLIDAKTSYKIQETVWQKASGQLRD